MTIETLLAKWTTKEPAGERAEYQQFLIEFAQALSVPTPGDEGQATGDYRFEAPVKSEVVYGGKGTKRIDLYKRDCFILEAKQAQPGWSPRDEKPLPPPVPILNLFGETVGHEPRKQGINRYDRLMSDALLQAKRYALSVPNGHNPPPFLIIADIGRAFEVYFDIGGNGRGYAPFPSERDYRVTLDQFRDPAIAARFRAIWTDPRSIDPRLIAAQVTREVADELVRVSRFLERQEEERGRGDVNVAMQIEETSLFMMRLLFCMFAEDVELLPKGSFQRFLADAEDRSDNFWRDGLTTLWSKMNDRLELNRFWSPGDATIRYFNGNFFASAKVFDLPSTHKRNLLEAAKRDWKAVEPAIFGTLLEQVLEATGDRDKLGAHYTPRAYVERIVEETILVVLRGEWEAVLAAARAKADAGDAAGAIADASAFAARLADLRVLDPACGTGNFLYVAMEQLLRLEGDARQFVIGLGGSLDPRVHPEQFLGLELNPRAAVIAELVLWIGWLRYRLQNTPDAIGEPVLRTLSNINMGRHAGTMGGGFDAVLTRDDLGQPGTLRPEWPEADFIVGNPPFIGGKDIRDRLGGTYAEALWRANPNVPKSADFVMHWWDRAATILTTPGTLLRRFGFVTTNSITQVFSRRVIERYLAQSPPQGGGGGEADGGGLPASARDRGEAPSVSASALPPPPTGEESGKLHLVMAVPDHPWTKASKDSAAVRIAMTVAAAGPGAGWLLSVTAERDLDADVPVVKVEAVEGVINADLSVGTDVTRVVPLLANAYVCYDGVKLHGKGFIVTEQVRNELGIDRQLGLAERIRPYLSGRDLAQKPRNRYVIDFFGLSEEVARAFPDAYQWLLKHVLPERKTNRRQSYRDNWWIFGEPRKELRPALRDLSRFIVTVDTAAHRIFQFLPVEYICDDKAVIIADEQDFTLGVVSSKVHTAWSISTGGWLGQGNDSVYVKSRVFDPFPFPVACEHDRVRIAQSAEALTVSRRLALEVNPSLTMTGLYNFVAAIRDGTLPPDKEAQATRARARIVAKLHDDLDLAVADAYGWGDEWRRAPLPPAEIVRRLVALNAERATEEAAGHVRWLRPDYQIPRFAPKPAPKLPGERPARAPRSSPSTRSSKMPKNDNVSGADATENGSGKKSEDGTEVPKGPAKGHEKDAHNSHGASKQNAGTGGHKG